MDIREYKDAFLSEALEYLSTLNNALVVLEKNPADKEQLHAIFRAVHTLKGMSATMGYSPMARLTHQMESALDPVRSGRIELTLALTDALFSCLDLLQEWLRVLETQDAIAEGPLNSILFMLDSAARGERSLSEGAVSKKARPAAPTGPDDVLTPQEETVPSVASKGKGVPALQPSPEVPSRPVMGSSPIQPVVHSEPLFSEDSVLHERSSVEPTPIAPPSLKVSGTRTRAKVAFPLTAGELDVLTDARSNHFGVFQIDVELDPECTFKDVRAFMVLRNINEMGEIVQSHPPPEDIEKGRFPNAFHLLVVTDKPAEAVRGSLMRISEISDVGVEPFPLEEARLKAVETPSGPPDPISEVHPENSKGAQETAPLAGPTTPGGAAGSGQSPTIRVHTTKLDKLMALVQELVIAKIRFEQVIAGNDLKELQDPFRNLHHITRDLQDEIMQVRMVPIKQVFERFPRMVRDLARKLGKDIDFIMEGAEVELDRTIVDELSEPLVHLLRNAVDHGLEPPEDRLRAGKPRTGTVSLLAKRERAYVHLSVSDDGRGIDIEKVRRKAVSLGIVSEDDSREMTEEELIRLVTLPGMSTVQVATDVSGRGVGVDVAKTKIESLGGTLLIHTRKGHGTTFNLKFPLTLAIIKALLVRCCGETFALPVANIVEMVDIPPDEIKWVQQQETLLLRDSVVPLYRLQDLLGMTRPVPPAGTGEEVRAEGETVPAAPVADEPDLIPILIFEVGDYHVGIILDEVLGQQEIAIKSLDRFLKGYRGYSGATILGNGSICLVLDVAGLLEDLVSRRYHSEGRWTMKEGADHAAQSR